MIVQRRLWRIRGKNDRHDERDEHQVDAVLRRRGDGDLGRQGVGPVSGDEADEESADGSRYGEDGSVVGDPDERPVLGQLDQDRRREGDEDAGVPAEEHDRTGREDERERHAAAVRPLDRDRIAAGERRRSEQRRDAEEQRRRMADGRKRVRGVEHGSDASDVNRYHERRQAVRHRPPPPSFD